MENQNIMDSDSKKNENEYYSRDTLYILRIQKIQKEIESAKRLIKKNVDILEIADRFIHNSFELVKDGISLRNKDLTEEEIKSIIRKNISITMKLKSNRKRNKIIG